MMRYSSITFSFLGWILLFAPVLAFSQPQVELTTDTTSPELVDIAISSTSDPAGHSCCVTPPPLQINLFLNNGSVNFSPLDNIATPGWFNFGPMVLDSNLDFSGESRSTVAGFGQILTILTGSITAEDKIEAEIKIGADGGLPQSQPITFAVDITPQFLFAFVPQPATDIQLSLDTVAMDIGDILIEDKELPAASGLDLFISMRVEDDTSEADWWILMQDNSAQADIEFYYYSLAAGAWAPGLEITHQGPLLNIPEPFKLIEGFVPPSNDYVIVFGVDREKNGLLDLDTMTAIGSRYRTGL